MVVHGKNIKSFWILFFALLLALAIGAGVWYYVTLNMELAYKKATTITDDNIYKIQLENNYQQNLYSVSDSLLAIDSAIDKVLVCQDRAMQQELLTEVAINSNNISVCVSALPLVQGDNAQSLEQVTNRIAQYSLALTRKLASGQQLTDDDIQSLTRISNCAHSLYKCVRGVMTSDSGMYITNSLFQDGANIINDAVVELDGEVFDIGKLVYEGMYADNVETDYIPITPVTFRGEHGVEIVKNFLKFAGNVKNVKYTGSLTNKGTLYSYTATTDMGSVEVMLTTQGKVAEFDCNYNDNQQGESKYTLKQCYDLATEFAQKIDSTFTPVWLKQGDNNLVFVHLVPQHKGILLYPELIKISVNQVTGKIEGMQAHKYSAHIIDRAKVKTGNFDYQSVTDKLYDGVNVTSVKYALVQKYGTLNVCYQLQCTKDKDTYYVYVDSYNGKVVDMFKVVMDEDGIGVM